MITLLSTLVLVRANEFGFGKLQEPYEADELSPLEGKVSAKRPLKRFRDISNKATFCVLKSITDYVFNYRISGDSLTEVLLASHDTLDWRFLTAKFRITIIALRVR